MKLLTLSLAIVATSVNASQSTQECRADSESASNNRFTPHVITSDIGDYKVVNDSATGLQWSFCFVGQQLSGDQTECTGKPTVPFSTENVPYADIRKVILETAQKESEKLDKKNQSWRLPSIKELLSIYNESCKPATYSAFSYFVDTSPEEISNLINTSLNHDIWSDYHVAFGLIHKGKAYQNYTVVSDSAVNHKDHKFYYTINFNDWVYPIDKDRNTSGLIRLVREIPKQ